MGTIKEFEKLQVWRSARILNNLVYGITKQPPFLKDFALRDQIRKASISVMSNIAEGLDAGYDGEFIRFLSYAFRSVAEIQSQLYTALDETYIDQDTFQKIHDQGADVRRQIRGLITYLSNNKRPSLSIREERFSYIAGEGDQNIDGFDIPPQFIASDLLLPIN
ncbi:MAG: four helix bundle protein [Anaerolineales bacterium]